MPDTRTLLLDTLAAMNATSLFYPGSDGIQLHALEWSQQGTPLLLLHGFGLNAHVWDELAPLLAPYYHVLALDMRGHGRSEGKPANEVDMWPDLESVVNATGFERLVLVGHSMGGRTALFFAHRYPERMAGLVLVDTGPVIDPRGAFRDRITTEAIAYLDQTQPELWEACRKIACPTLIVRGAASNFFSAETAEQMVAILPNAKLVTVPQAAHAVMTDNPDAFNKAILDFALC